MSTEKLKQRIAENLQVAIEDMDTYPAELAEQAGLSPATVSNILNRKKMASVTSLLRLSKVLRMPLSIIVGERDFNL